MDFLGGGPLAHIICLFSHPMENTCAMGNLRCALVVVHTFLGDICTFGNLCAFWCVSWTISTHFKTESVTQEMPFKWF